MTRILHLIATPFPWFWHTLQDNASNLDLPTISRCTLKKKSFGTYVLLERHFFVIFYLRYWRH
jgi:hypothetical protein